MSRVSSTHVCISSFSKVFPLVMRPDWSISIISKPVADKCWAFCVNIRWCTFFNCSIPWLSILHIRSFTYDWSGNRSISSMLASIVSDVSLWLLSDVYLQIITTNRSEVIIFWCIVLSASFIFIFTWFKMASVPSFWSNLIMTTSYAEVFSSLNSPVVKVKSFVDEIRLFIILVN